MVNWFEWGSDAFKKASREGNHVLLYIRTFWCRSCDKLEEDFKRRGLGSLTNKVVPVKVDGEVRPDVALRYSLGGYPTIALLNDKGDLLAAVVTDELTGLERALGRVVSRPAKPEGAGWARVWDPRPTEYDLNELRDRMVLGLLSSYDKLNGGFGGSPKFHFPEALMYLTNLWVLTKKHVYKSVVEKTLTRVLERGIYDSRRGGLYRYSRSSDWNAHSDEKTLADNCLMAVAYSMAYKAFKRPALREASLRLLGYVVDNLFDGRFFHPSQKIVDGRPTTDPRVLLSKNSLAAWSFIVVAAVTGREGLGELALRSLTDSLKAFSSSNGVLKHYQEAPGFLEDYSWTLLALTEAYQYTLDDWFVDKAIELHQGLERLFKSKTGAFYDSPSTHENIGLLRVRLTPVIDNSLVAVSLLRLSVVTGDEGLLETSKQILRVLASIPALDPSSAMFGIALEAIEHPVVVNAGGVEMSRRAMGLSLGVVVKRCPPGGRPGVNAKGAFADADHESVENQVLRMILL